MTTQVYDSLSMPAGQIRPTMVVSTVNAGAIVAPPATSATPSATGLGITAKIAKVTASSARSRANCRAAFRAGGRVPNQKPPTALPVPHRASRTPATLSASEEPCASAYAGTATPVAPNATPSPATQRSRAGNPPTRSGPSPRACASRGCGRRLRSARPSATTVVPTSVTAAAPTSAARASATSTKSATRDGPTTKTSSKREVSAASAVLRRANRPEAGSVRSFHAPRIAAVVGGYVAPARADATKITASASVPARLASSRPTSATGWATAVASSTGLGPTRSATRPAIGLRAAPASAYTPPAAAASAYRPVTCSTTISRASGVMPMPSRPMMPATSSIGAPGIRHTCRY